MGFCHVSLKIRVKRSKTCALAAIRNTSLLTSGAGFAPCFFVKAETGKISLLLVDDNRNNLIALSAILDRPDYNLVLATSGKEALQYLSQIPVALVLLDVMMPEMDGFGVASIM